MKKNEWPQYGNSFEDPFSDLAIVDSPEQLVHMIDWIFGIGENPEITKKPGFWEYYCSDVFGRADMFRHFDRELTHPPDLPLDLGDCSRKNLMDLRDWCTDPRGQAQHGIITQDIISIDAAKFSNGKTWGLLKALINDERRSGVQCEQRTLRTLKERLIKVGKDVGKDCYIKLAKSLKYKGGIARTTILYGKIQISPKI